MTVDSGAPEDLDQQLRAQLELSSKHQGNSFFHSAFRLANEVKRQAKASARLLPYLSANFTIMNSGAEVMELEAGKQAAIENIALLESPERARTFQGDVDEAEYEHTVHWMSACSYDNLAATTGKMQGYNSEGMQACIADGMAICRRTGKLRCLACFREYATQVHRSADDLDMALHHAQTNQQRTPHVRTDDRRWVGAYDEADLQILMGRLDVARDAAKRALEFSETYHAVRHARRQTLRQMRVIAALARRDDWASEVPAEANPVPKGEDVLQDLEDERAECLKLCLAGEFAQAIDRLAAWDKRLSTAKDLHHGLDLRLQIIAAMRMAGQTPRAEAMAKLVKQSAAKANDYLSIRRLESLMKSDPATPYATVAPMSAGASVAPGAVISVSSSPDDSKNTPPSAGPLDSTITAIEQRVAQVLSKPRGQNEMPDFSAEMDDLLAIPAAEHPLDATRILHGVSYMLPARPRPEAWAWGQKIAAPHQQNGIVLNALATLGATFLRLELTPTEGPITADTIRQLFRQSLMLDAQQPRGFFRAGKFFLEINDASEAERCLARAFRLAREDPAIAMELAALYGQTQRPSEALAVLDMCLRAGAREPDLLWQAGVRASGLGRHEAAVTYLRQLEEIAPGRPGAAFYLAMSLCAVGKFDEAAEAVELEAKRISRPDALHLISVRASIAAGQKQLDRLTELLDQVLAIRLSKIDYLSPGALAASLERLGRAAEALPEETSQRKAIEGLLIATGLIPDVYFYRLRKLRPVQKAVNYYVVSLHQSLGADWANSRFCLPGQEKLTALRFAYGVLAKEEDEAGRYALEGHGNRHAVPATVESISPAKGPYDDSPGITSQMNVEAIEPNAETERDQ